MDFHADDCDCGPTISTGNVRAALISREATYYDDTIVAVWRWDDDGTILLGPRGVPTSLTIFLN